MALNAVIPAAHVTELQPPGFTKKVDFPSPFELMMNELNNESYSKEPRRSLVKPNGSTDINLKDFAKAGGGLLTGLGTPYLLQHATKVPIFSTILRGFGWTGSAMLAIDVLNSATIFESNYFALTTDFDDIMDNLLLNQSQKNKVWSNAHERMASAQKDIKNFKQNFKENPFEIGLFLGAGAFIGFAATKPVIAPLGAEVQKFLELRTLQTAWERFRGTRSVPSLNLRVIETNPQFGQSAWQSFKSNPRERIRITGGRSTLDIILAEEQRATELYSKIRHSTNDVSQIATNLNIPAFQVQRVKDHLFHNTHQLDHGLGIGRFHPDFKIATAWQRLEAGTHTEADLLIFRHEHFESRFEGIFRTDYRAAHDAANRAGHPSGLRDVDSFEFKPGDIKWDY